MGQRQSSEVVYHHIVQTDKEEALVRRLGGKVVLNIQAVVRNALKTADGPCWSEPEDMREVTSFSWSAIEADRYLTNYHSTLRARIAGALQREVARLFVQHHYDGFLSEPVALFITHLILYHCRKRGTRPLLWCNTYFGGYFYFADKAEISTPVRRVPIQGSDAEMLHKTVTTYARGIIEDRVGPVYHHAFMGTKSRRLSYFQQRAGRSPLVLRAGLTSRLIQIARVVRAMLARARFPNGSDFMTAGAVSEHLFYLRCLLAPSSTYNEIPQEYSNNNVVYPLQYEPEASILYFAPHFRDQVSFVENILRSLPQRKVLWVKEHPNQFGALNEPSWRALMKRYDNLRFINGRQNGRELIKKSALVVTITSTMGLDALILGRKVLVGGEVFFSRFTGAIRIESYLALAKELNTPANYEYSDNFAHNVDELVKFGRYAYLGDPQPSSYLFSDENLTLLELAIKKELF
jgi:hypothetical protein